MNPAIQEFVCSVTGAYVSFHLEDIQSLWSGYGKIMRYGLKGSAHKTAIVKHVDLAAKKAHPRGWNTDLAHARKVRSYEVERAWYRDWARDCDDACRIPRCYGIQESEEGFIMVLEDLDHQGFPQRMDYVDVDLHVLACLDWLAHFHASFMGRQPEGLWAVGTYWHLDTRPDEYAALDDEELRAAAPLMDQRLNSARFQTIVHGDAKLENFCFSNDGRRVAAVDFQYVGGGCGMKDVAYFLGSCLDEQECAQQESRLLEHYFSALRTALADRYSAIEPDELETEWRGLYDFAWADFYRFLKGWSPGHWKIHGYTKNKVCQALEQLEMTTEEKNGAEERT